MEIKEIVENSEIKMAFDSIKMAFPDLHMRVNIDEYINKICSNANVFTICEDEAYYGFCAVYMNDSIRKEAYITLIGTHPQIRGKGYGNLLFNRVEKEAREKGMKNIRLEVNKKNDVALCFYKRNGMKVVKEATEYSLYMEKKLV